jgi:hypothetical protein
MDKSVYLYTRPYTRNDAIPVPIALLNEVSEWAVDIDGGPQSCLVERG